MKHYFVVVELPGGEELKFVDGKNSPLHFWETALSAVSMGNAPIISSREDTGICEDFWKYVANLKKFTTFVLLNLDLCPNALVNQAEIYKQFNGANTNSFSETVIDAAYNFQLVTINA